VVAERAAEQARRAREEYEQHLEVKREAKRAADMRQAEAARRAAEAAELEERQRVAEEERRAALRKPKEDKSNGDATKDRQLFS